MFLLVVFLEKSFNRAEKKFTIWRGVVEAVGEITELFGFAGLLFLPGSALVMY